LNSMNTLRTPFRLKRRLHSFTLVELLTVLAITSILALASLSAYSQIMRAQALGSSAQMMTGALDVARQSAITYNNRVEFRLYQLPGENAAASAPPSAYRAFQTFLIKDNTTNALTKVTFLPAPAVVASDAAVCSIASIPTTPGSAFTQGGVGTSSAQNLPIYQNNYNALVFDFTPSGGLEATGSLTASSSWYLTLWIGTDPIVADGLPKNFATIQIDPFSGQTKTFRP
jgi:uncharacterized protein (TIGR02596 family)